MALKNCKECGNPASTKAKVCPTCGAPVKARGRYGCGTLLLIILAGIVVVNLLPDSGGSGGRGIQGVGYFQDDARNRVRTFSIAATADEATVRAHAEDLVSTAGQVMAAYYYTAGSTIPADGVTLAGNLVNATEVIYEDPNLSAWRFAFMRYFNGSIEFVDCTASPRHDLCRQ